MTLTRSQRGITPRKTERPGFVETPSRRKSTRISSSPVPKQDQSDEANDAIAVQVSRKANGKANGHSKKASDGVFDGWRKGMDPKVDYSGHFEFGGQPGVAAIMIGFPTLMYYMWIGATYYNGKLPLPAKDESFTDFMLHLGRLVYTGAFPSMKAWAIYWVFFLFEMVCYCVLPGVYAKGKPLDHEGGKQLTYFCNGVWSQWTTITIAAIMHLTGVFKLWTLIDEFGPIMSVAIISGFGVSVAAYFSALYRGAEHRMTGKPIYDFFMGAELNPRMFGILDFKMFFEVRIPWYIMLLTTSSVAARQYEQYGWVPLETAFLVMAHFLYANACSKGEQLIVPTWDMYYEKWGFMLIFWNMAGVPLSYVHCTLFLANHAPSEFYWNRYAMAALFVLYLFAYWVWDTTNSQKNTFRHEERGGGYQPRKAFPQLPWQSVTNPKIIKTTTGDSILADGWYGWARKPHYTCDLIFALSWGLVTGFSSPFPWFYPIFFACMISHRALRDIQRCRKKYGEAWREYERQVPYLFIPYVL